MYAAEKKEKEEQLQHIRFPSSLAFTARSSFQATTTGAHPLVLILFQDRNRVIIRRKWERRWASRTDLSIVFISQNALPSRMQSWIVSQQFSICVRTELKVAAELRQREENIYMLNNMIVRAVSPLSLLRRLRKQIRACFKNFWYLQHIPIVLEFCFKRI